MKSPIVIIGSGGHAVSAVDLIESLGSFEILGFWDYAESNVHQLCGYRRLKYGTLSELVKEDIALAIGHGQIKSARVRKELFLELVNRAVKIPALVSPQALVSKRTRIGMGCQLMPRVTINAEVEIEDNCIINTGAILEHGVTVEAHCHISTSAVLNGNCRIGEGSFVGSNATVKQGVSVGRHSVIGAGSVVLCDTEAHKTYAGNPARLIPG